VTKANRNGKCEFRSSRIQNDALAQLGCLASANGVYLRAIRFFTNPETIINNINNSFA